MRDRRDASATASPRSVTIAYRRFAAARIMTMGSIAVQAQAARASDVTALAASVQPRASERARGIRPSVAVPASVSSGRAWCSRLEGSWGESR